MHRNILERRHGDLEAAVRRKEDLLADGVRIRGHAIVLDDVGQHLEFDNQ